MPGQKKGLYIAWPAYLLVALLAFALTYAYDANRLMAPSIGPILPSSVCAGSNGFELTLSGRRFSPSSVVLWNGSPRNTEYVASERLLARITAKDVASPGMAYLRVDDQAKHGRKSNAAMLKIISSCSSGGPLHTSKVNPRYFTDSSGRAIYLTGSHTWSNFKNLGPNNPSRASHFARYLDFLQRHGHNFIRLWTWELTTYDCGGGISHAWPFPWLRTGPGVALDGGKRFDLSQLNQAYFDRLRSRIMAAQARHIYVSVMLFEGFGLHYCRASLGGFPLLGANNVNGINAPGTSSHTLQYPAVTAIQEAYVRKVIDTINDLDNVLYEIANESGPYSTAWQYHMIDYVRAYEVTKQNQHPIGMTFQYRGGTNAALFASHADWISPAGKQYRTDPPPATGAKVILTDTDHIFGVGGDRTWVWKSFTRGLNPLFMDDMSLDQHNSARNAMGVTAKVAKRIDLLHMAPHGNLASTHYCLANPGSEYLVYAPSGGSFSVDLRAALPSDVFVVEWINPEDISHPTGNTQTGVRKVHGGAWRRFAAPFSVDSVLHLKRTPVARLSSP